MATKQKSTKPKAPRLDKYRPNAAIVVFNKKGKVLLCRRAGETGERCWQFPQGGIDQGEKPLAAAYRELCEETGIKRKQVRKIGKIKGWLTYDYPDDVKAAPRKRRHWQGQKQKWFAMRFSGPDSAIDLNAHKPVEFDEWCWIKLEKTPQKVIKWKSHVYDEVVRAFARFAKP